MSRKAGHAEEPEGGVTGAAAVGAAAGPCELERLWSGAAGERQSVRPARTRMKVGLFVRPRIRASGSSPREVVAALKAKPGRDIWLYGGGDFFRSLLNAGLVDTVEVAVVPVLLGAGVLLLPPGTATKLTLADHKMLPAVASWHSRTRYQVASARPPHSVHQGREDSRDG